MVFMNLRTILSIIGAKTKTLVTAKAALQSMVAGIEGNETPDSGYLSRRDGTGGTGLGHCDIPKDLVGFEAPQGDGVLPAHREQRRIRHKVGGYLAVSTEVLYKEPNGR